jgi:hypothetical protein
VTPVECLLLAAHAVDRRTAVHWLTVAVDKGLPLADKRRALHEWDAAHRTVRWEAAS